MIDEKVCLNEDGLPLGFLLNKRFVIKGYKNSGANSIVYIADDLYNKKDIIIKEYYKRDAYVGRDFLTGLLIPIEEEKRRVEKGIELFIREAEKLQHLDDQRIIPKIYCFGKQGKYNAYIAMEYLKAKSIFELKIRTANQMLDLFEPLINIIAKMHTEKIIHGDLNIHNLLLVDNKIRLIDLGIAQKIRDDRVESELDGKRISTHLLITKIIQQKRKEHPIYQIDIQALASIMLDVYNYNSKNFIFKSKKIEETLRSISKWKMNPEYNIMDMYKELYEKKKRIIRALSFVSIGIMLIITCSIYYNSQIDGITETVETLNDNLINSEEKEQLIKNIESACGYKIQEQYIAYEDFDGNGMKELFAFIPTEIDQEQSDIELGDWINYGEVWFADNKETVKVDEIGLDDWQGGGFYAIDMLQFGNAIHVQLNKYYMYSIDFGPVHIYAYENKMPIRTYEGYVKNLPFVDGGADTGVYYSQMGLKGTTQLSMRTWDKIYVYYKNGEYISYKSNDLKLSELFKYENFNEVLIEGLQNICAGEFTEEVQIDVTSTTEIINGKEIYVYQCISESGTLYATLFNSYSNESGRVYLNLTIWDSKEAYLKSSIWSEDEWHQIYKDPVENISEVSAEYIGYNFYITFKINRNNLYIEEVCRGFWE